MTENAISTTPTPNPWSKLKNVAERLGVEPVEDGCGAEIIVDVGDNVKYDLFEVIEAFLDRMDNEARPS